jgi:2-haloacid dehalogenase
MKIPGVKALAFDVGGTVFDWRGTIEAELQSLSANRGVELDVRQFASDWRGGMFAKLALVKSGELPRINADEIHRVVLDEVLENHSTLQLSSDERDELNQVWHRLNTWPDAVDAIHRLRDSYTVNVLTVLSYAIAVDCSKFNGLSWDGILSCEFLERYKTDARAYQQAAELLRLEPGEVMMVAAHTGDLMGAKNAGLKTAYVYQDDWIRESSPHEPVRALDNFDVSAKSFGELVEMLT